MRNLSWSKVELAAIWALNWLSAPSNVLLLLTILYTLIRLIREVRDFWRTRRLATSAPEAEERGRPRGM